MRIISLVSLVLQHLVNGQLPPTDVIKQLLSEGLGIGIVAGSFLVKLPQIANVVTAKSAQGLNPTSFEIETFCVTVAATYGFAHRLSFSAFGESVAITIQNIVLLWLIYSYQKRSTLRRATVLVCLVAWIGAAYGGLLTPGHLAYLFDINSVVLLVSRIPQIVQNYTSKSTGQLSIITYGLNLLGTLARIFTTMQEKNAGAAMMRGVIMCRKKLKIVSSCYPVLCAAAAMNAIMVGQILAYGNQKASGKSKKNV